MVAALLALATAGGSGAYAAAMAPSEDIPISFSADEMSYDSQLGIITATGNVEVSDGIRMLFADTVTYNQRLDLLTASGSVSMVEPNGDVLFGEYVELTGDMKDGIIEDIRMVLSDRSRIAAAGARRSADRTLDMRNAVYSPCNLCPDDPERPPLWQIKAFRVVHDKESRTIEYTDAFLEIAGVPVAYMPYLSHPDPTVKRQSGFLTPSLGGSSDLGFIIRTPYFFNLSPSSDFTFNPLVTFNEGVVLAGEYRTLLRDGEVNVKASITEDSEDDIRGHLAGKGRFDIDDTWSWGIDVNRALDDTYMRRYGYMSDNTISASNNNLTTKVFAEGFRKRNYMAFNAYAFQGLSEEDNEGNTPYIFPMIDYNHVGEPDRFGGRASLDANMLVLTRTDGMDTRRLSLNGGWRLPYVGPEGGLYTLSTSLKGDLYHVNELKRSGGKKNYTGAAYRLVPQVELNWRYPLVREEGSVYQLIEPIVSAVISPYGGNPDNIPNEDSQEFEFDDTNLFSSNRFTGIDRVEGGPRLNYGLSWSVYGSKGGQTTVLVGQSYKPRVDDTFAKGSGLEDHFSDIVGKVLIAPTGLFNFLYRTRLDKENMEARRNEVKFSAGPPALTINTSYVYFDRQEDSLFERREEISMSLNSRFNRYWRGGFRGTRDLSGGGEMRSMGIDLVYEDECLVFTTVATRTFFEDRDIEPAISVLFRVEFKTLGEVKTGVSQFY